MTNIEQESTTIDESFYSRQLYVLGPTAMVQMAQASVLISGLGGLGCEIAKNVILAGVKAATLHDSEDTRQEDLSSNFYLVESDICRNRAEACCPRLAALNSHVHVESYSGKLTEEFLCKFQVVVLCNEAKFERIATINEICRTNCAKFVYAATKGLFGQLFCDFGEHFQVKDPDDSVPASALVESVTIDSNHGIVKLTNNGSRGFEVGDLVMFRKMQGTCELNDKELFEVKSTIDGFVIDIGDTSSFAAYEGGGEAVKVKMPVTLNFKTFRESLENPEHLHLDFTKPPERSDTILAGFRFINAFEKQAPTRRDDRAPDFAAFCSRQSEKPLEKDILEAFYKGRHGDLCPVNSFIGGMAAQEVLKAVSEKFMPIFQWVFSDSLECLSEVSYESDVLPSRYSGITSVFGDRFVDILANAKIFVIGSGAIGCELLKNLAMLGVGRCGRGKIIVTDMDSIERSNLNRQFLFRPNDVGKSKSMSAANAVKIMNPDIKIEAHFNKVCEETEDVYDDAFFEDIDVVMNALDNVSARVYSSERCVQHLKPFIDGGTQGTSGNVQVALPHLTESFIPSSDSRNQAIPICTIKLFPHSIAHTIQWAKEKFYSYFTEPAVVAEKYILEDDFIQKTFRQDANQGMEMARLLKETLLNRPATFEDCLRWARLRWEEDFNMEIQRLLRLFPPNAITNDSSPFWLGEKRCPRPMFFNADEHLYIQFVNSAAVLRAQMFNLKEQGPWSKAEVRNLMENMESSKMMEKLSTEPKVVVADVDQNASLVPTETSQPESIEKIIACLPSRKTLGGQTLSAIVFEKDDDTNFHMDFITSAANGRARNYDIPVLDRLSCKQIAGQIIPAIATSTSVVAGLATLEMLKILQGYNGIANFKDSFFSLGSSFFMFMEPGQPTVLSHNGVEWTVWDRFETHDQSTLGVLLQRLEEERHLSFVNLTSLAVILYDDLVLPQEEIAKRIDMTIPEIYRMISGKDVPKRRKAMKLLGNYKGSTYQAPPPPPIYYYGRG